MKPLEYKAFCETTYACPPGTDREEYLQLLLIEELGKVASLFAKAVNREALIKALGDVMWCAAMLDCIEDWFAWPQLLDPFGIDRYAWSFQNTSPLEAACSMCQYYGFTPEAVALANVEKLKGRVRRGTLHGKGDER